jgi:hypothetical protein
MTRQLACGIALVALLIAASVGQAFAISAPIHIANTGGEGVYLRSEPSTSGVRLRLIPEGFSPDYNCFVWGQDVNGVPIWFNVNYAGATGYYSSYYDDSSYHSNEELTAKYGVPLCGAAPSAPPPTPVAPTGSGPPSPSGPQIELLPDGGSAYYAPDNGQHSGAPSPATYTLPYTSWTSTNCGTSRATPYQSWAGRRLSTLAGFSIGRLGPIYFLQANRANRGEWARIHYILLIDPGGRKEYEDTCDRRYPQSQLLAEWLTSNPGNRLAILAGKVTADYAHPDHGHGHAGIQDALFPRIRGRTIAKQVLVCNFDRMEHWDVFRNFASYMNKPPITGGRCPAGGFPWNP